MQITDSSLMARLKIHLGALFTALLIVTSLTVVDIVSAELITFDEYPGGTQITNQYQNRGVVFSGDPLPPVIYSTLPMFGVGNPVLGASSTEYGSSSITGIFVNPDDGSPAEASNVSLWAYFYFGSYATSGTMSYYDINGIKIGEQGFEPVEGEMPPFIFPSKLNRFVLTPGIATRAWINNLNFQLVPLIIRQPKVDDAHELSQTNYTKTEEITFQAVGVNTTSKVNWTATLYYATSGNRGQYTFKDSFTSPLNLTTTRTYQSKGGQMTVTATCGKVSAPSVNYAYVLGVAIPDSEITSRLYALYGGATPNLLTGIAMKESTYRQFADKTLFGKAGKWPNESYDGGSHIGLMMVPITMADSWDWQTNTQNGANMFAEKVQIARSVERQLRRQYRSLRSLTGAEIENMALVLYGPNAHANDPQMQYFIPQPSGNNVDWVINTANNPKGVTYADSVRSLVR